LLSTSTVHTSEHRPVRERGSKKQATTAGQVAFKPNSSATHGAAVIDSHQRDDMIRKSAYFRAASRRFCPGQEVEDWLAAETEIDRMLANRERPRFCDY
jgi:Protein of unknown function (DUF2934)